MMKAHVYLQSMGIAHRDIKPENIILVSLEPLDYKICDVGVGTDTSNDSNQTKTRTLIGTLAFISQELLQNFKEKKLQSQYNPFKTDVYSLGLCLIYFLTQRKYTSSERLEMNNELFHLKLRKQIKELKMKYTSIPSLSKVLKFMLLSPLETRPDFILLQKLLEEFNFYELQEVKTQ